MNTIYSTFTTIGDIAEPRVGETLWDWMDRTKNYMPNLRSAGDMRKMWSCAVIHENDIGIIRNSDEWQANQDHDNNIMVWGNHVFFSDEGTMAIFRLQYSEYIVVLSIVTRQEFKYVRKTNRS